MKCLICSSSINKKYSGLYDDRYGAEGEYDLYHCKNCGFGRLDPILKNSEIGKFYAKHYPLKNVSAESIVKNSTPYLTIADWIFGTDNVCHKYPKTGLVLDIGSASGQSVYELNQKGCQGYGVEPDPTAQKIARKLNLKIEQGLLSDKTFKNKKFDVITGSQVLEHEGDPRKFLKVCKKKLTENGNIILSFPNNSSLSHKLYGRFWINWHVPYHCNFFTIKSFELLVKELGLNIKEVRTITPNIWTALQLLSPIYYPKKGEKGMLWDTNNSLTLHTRLMLIFLYIILTPLNRLVDLLGYGESIFVILETNEKNS